MFKTILYILAGLIIILATLLSFIDLFPEQSKKLESNTLFNTLTKNVLLINKKLGKIINTADKKIFYFNQ